ncbi:hypothetical protein Tco_1276373 [Tanacetum coccineum]
MHRRCFILVFSKDDDCVEPGSPVTGLNEGCRAIVSDWGVFGVDDEEKEEEEDPEMEEEMEEENDVDAEVINPYEEADPLNLPPPDSDTESEDMAVAPTPNDHEQEAKADTVGTITRVPYSVRPFSGTVYVGRGPSRQTICDPDDPSPRPTRRPQHDDPYFIVRDVATRNEGDDTATTSDPQPSLPLGSPHYHL